MLLLLEKLSTEILSSALRTTTIIDTIIIATIITILATITTIDTIGAVTNTSRGDTPGAVKGEASFQSSGTRLANKASLCSYVAMM
jgi:hypothetical protein